MNIFLKNIKMKLDYTIKKIEYKLFLASAKGKMTIKYLVPRVKIGSSIHNYREDTRFLDSLVSSLESKGYDVWVDNNDLAHYHVVYISIK